LATEPTRPPQNVAQAVAEITERASLLIREEIELAKAELSERAMAFGRAGAVGAMAGIFVVTGLLFVLEGFAWLISAEVFDAPYAGFFVMAFLLFVFGVIAGYVTWRFTQRGTRPVMAVDEARKIRSSISEGPS
jgi:hypothetical protein